VSRPWIDISVPLRSGMVVWPGDPPVRIERISALAEGAVANVSAVSMGMHTGTHVDAPLHFLDDGPGMAEMPLDALTGPARVIRIRNPRAIGARDIERLRIRRGERILFKTRNSARCWRAKRFCDDYVHLARDAAACLVRHGIRAVGIDYLSIGAPNEAGYLVHRMLLGAGIWIVEGLDLSSAPPGRCDLVCLPLKAPGADGAPARAMLRPRP
jgi:arylformamidase